MNPDTARDPLTQRILDLTLEMIFLLTGEVHMVMKIHEMVTDNSRHQISEGGYCRTQRFNTEPPPHSGIPEQNDEKILELTNKIIRLLTGEVPIRCEDVTVYLSMEEWEYVERHKDLYEDVMKENHRPVMALDKSVSGESHTPVSLSDSGNKSITNNVEQHLNKQTKGRAESATNTDQESLASGEEQVPNKTNYSTIKCTEYSPSDIKQEPASWEEENLTDVTYKGNSTSDMGKYSYSKSDLVIIETNCKEETFSPSVGGENSTPDSALIHQHLYTEEQPFTYPECGKYLTNQLALKKHQRIHMEKKMFNCTECGKYSTSPSKLAGHKIIHTGQKPFTCTECGNSFKRASALAMHKIIHTGDDKPCECTDCKKCFKWASGLSTDKIIDTRQKTFKCTECGKCFKWASAFSRHKRIHTGEKPFNCTVCGKCFLQSSHLARHELIHTGDKPFNCTVCGKCFKQASRLARHNMIHTEEKKFKCSECGKCFKKASYLARHNMIHTGEKPFKCTVCGKGFTEATFLARHNRIHTGEKPYKCTECGKCFTYASSLVAHKITHTRDKTFNCPECGKCFKQTSAFARHMDSHRKKKSLKYTQ
uniref:C2H2-type domain-containing protein n=1 Tax=Leptobrachium leishanense TaxID=445787 RepID=A0A8C5PPC3_9ANUR